MLAPWRRTWRHCDDSYRATVRRLVRHHETIGTLDGRFFTMDRFAVTAGRRPAVDRDNEIAVNETAAKLYGYYVGQQLDLGTYSDEQLSSDSFFDDPPPP